MEFRVYGGSLSDCGWSPISISTPPSLDTYPARVGSNLSLFHHEPTTSQDDDIESYIPVHSYALASIMLYIPDCYKS